jgi:hypothetical protein
MLEKRKIFLLVICFAALCLSVAPAMADLVDFTAYETLMTVDVTGVGDGTTATTTIEAQYPTSSLDMYMYDGDGSELQSLIMEPYVLTATFDFTGAGDDYSAIGSLVVNDTTSSTKIAADFVSTTVTFEPISAGWGGHWASRLTMTGNLTPQGTNTSILLGGSSWVFVGTTGTISLANADDFDHGDMMILQYYVPYGSLQDFFVANGARDAYGLLNAQIHSPIPPAVLLGIIGLGVAGLKLRKYA